MSFAKYIIRLDDACHTSNFRKWQAIEKILDEYQIKPVVAVIPDNRDPTLHYSQKARDFWPKVRKWQSKGWAIAMHGFQHRYHYVDRDKLIIPFYFRSEFAGLPLEMQRQKIRSSYKMLIRNDVHPKLWVAPAHSFDETTLEALNHEVPFKIISDGIALNGFATNGFYFIPQQLWALKKQFFGTWTVCLHPDTMTWTEIESFKNKLKVHQLWREVIEFDDLELNARPKSYIDRLYSIFFWTRYRVANFLNGMKKHNGK